MRDTAPGRPSARAGRWDRAAAPGGCPRRGSRPRRATRRGSSSGARRRRHRARWRPGRPGRAGARATVPSAVDTVTPASPGASCSAVCSDDDHLAVAVGRPRRQPSVPQLQMAALPLQAGGQPAGEQQRAGHRGLPVADLQLLDLAQRREPLGQVEGRRQPLAPRRRAQPRQVDDVGVLAQALGAGERVRRDRPRRRSPSASRRSAAARRRPPRRGRAATTGRWAAPTPAPGRRSSAARADGSGPRSISTVSCMTPSAEPLGSS